MTDPKLPDDLRADVAAELPCLAGCPGMLAGGQHALDCPATHRPAVEALLAKALAEAKAHHLFADVVRDEIAADRDTLRRELASIKAVRGEHDCGCEVCSTVSAVCPASASSYAIEIVGLRRELAETREALELAVTIAESALYIGSWESDRIEDFERDCADLAAHIRALTPKGATDGE
jgi:hypothetical protein